MANDHIATYLNDHLAGSVVALELLGSLEAAHGKTPLKRFFTELRIEVTDDRLELERLLSHLQLGQSPLRKAAAWIVEKVTALKLKLDDSASEGLGMLEALEALSLGIEGKKSLWRALAVTSKHLTDLQILDYERLIERADVQRNKVESLRLEVAVTALAS